MRDLIAGIHHISAMARDAAGTDRFMTGVLGLRRVKKTVNFEEPSGYHLYYGEGAGTPGSILTYFPFPNIAPGRPGTGEVGEMAFAIPKGSLPEWKARLTERGVTGILAGQRFGEKQMRFAGPHGEAFALVERDGDGASILGFAGASLRLRDGGATEELLKFMGYALEEAARDMRRYRLAGGNGADVIDIEILPNMERGRLGAGSVHHIAFSVAGAKEQAAACRALGDAGYLLTEIRDRTYFQSVYFRTPGGVLFEIATDGPGFGVDEDEARLGQELQLPPQHAHMRAWLETHLPQL